MKQAFTVLALGWLLPLHPVYAQETETIGADYEDPEDKTYTPEEQAAALATVKDVYAQRLSIIQKINNKETADAAVNLLDQQQARITPEVFLAIQSLNYAELLNITNSIKAAKTQFATHKNKIKQQYYFGSATLAQRLSGCAAFAAPPSPLPEDMQQWIIIKNPAQALTDSEITATGGPGFTQDTAWQLSFPVRKGAKEGVGVYMDSSINISAISKQGWSWDTRQLNTVFADGKVYYHLTADLYTRADARHAKYYMLEQWYDISASFPFASEAEWHAQLECSIENLKKLNEVLSLIQSKESADEKAEQVAALVAAIRTGYAAHYLLDESTPFCQEFINSANIHFRKMSEEVTRIRRENFFGSETLQEVIKPEGKF